MSAKPTARQAFRRCGAAKHLEAKPDDRGRVNLSGAGDLAQRYLVLHDPETGRIELEPVASLPQHLVDMATERPGEFLAGCLAASS